MSDPIENQFPRAPGKLRIYFHISENSGVGYYRLYLPAVKLREHGLANVMISDFKWGEGDHQEPNLQLLTKILEWADIVVVGRKDQGQFYAQWGALKEVYNIPIILDTDDNVQHVRPSNPGYQGYHPGSEAITWNKLAISKVFDAITVSTKNLKEWYKRYNPKIFELPNMLDVKWWDSYPTKKWRDSKVRICFMASAAHPEGVRIIREPILKILRKYPQVEFSISKFFLGAFEKETDVKDRIKPIDWIKLEEWPKRYKELGFDIGLAPLADNMFNRGKSNLRWLEYSVQGIPSIVSPVEAYSCVRDGIDAFVAKEKEDWFSIIESLVLDKKLRKKVGKTAMDRVKNEYNIETGIVLWLEVYKDIFEKYHDFFGKKKRFFVSNKGLQEIGVGKKR